MFSVTEALQFFVSLPRRQRRALLLAIDFAILLATVWGLLSLRYGEPYTPQTLMAVIVLLIGPTLTIATFLVMRVYHLVARYLGLLGAMRVFGGVMLATAVWAALLLFAGQHGVSRLTLFGYVVVGSTLVVSYRFIAANMLKSIGILVERHGRRRTGIPVLVYGTGELAVQIGRELRRSKTRRLVGYVDDSPSMIGRKIDGVKIHRPERIGGLVDAQGVEEILVALEHQCPSDRRSLLVRLERHRLRVRIVPDLDEIASGRISLSQLRAVEGRDMLGREEIAPDPEFMDAAIRGKSILVTGAGGSIGSQLARHVFDLSPSLLVLLDNSEPALYQIEKELRDLASNSAGQNRPRLLAVLGSVQNEALIKDLLSHNVIATIFHAAAFKHVPIVEQNALVGIQNNVFGTEVMARAARQFGVERFVLVSTDKAVRPKSVMGASKRLAEVILQDLAVQSTTIFTVVRFGNVLDSSGSVLPLFRQQIAAGGPVTVTDPNVTRYFMSINEATSLVIQAAGMATGGEIFVLDMGSPVRIDDIARSMIRLMGLEVRTPDCPEGEIEIVYTGLRPGEKLVEELVSSDGTAIDTVHPRILKAIEPVIDPVQLRRELEALRAAIDTRQTSMALAILAGLIGDTSLREAWKAIEPEPSNVIYLR